jgi:hypothetical protein
MVDCNFLTKVPPEIEHTLIWTRLPILHASLFPFRLYAYLVEEGISGFTGLISPAPESNVLPDLPSLAEWNLTESDLKLGSLNLNLSEEEERAIHRFKDDIGRFVKRRWTEDEWETGWWITPLVRLSLAILFTLH